METGSATDLALGGPGFFVVRDGEHQLYTRQGRFARDGEGRLVSASGQILQSADGGDLKIAEADFTVSPTGLVSVKGEALDRVAVVEFDDLSGLRAATGEAYTSQIDARAVSDPLVRQGFLEAANVSTGDEMIALMAAVRRAEAGQRLVNVYDDLLGRAATVFGQV